MCHVCGLWNGCYVGDSKCVCHVTGHWIRCYVGDNQCVCNVCSHKNGCHVWDHWCRFGCCVGHSKAWATYPTFHADTSQDTAGVSCAGQCFAQKSRRRRICGSLAGVRDIIFLGQQAPYGCPPLGTAVPRGGCKARADANKCQRRDKQQLCLLPTSRATWRPLVHSKFQPLALSLCKRCP